MNRPYTTVVLAMSADGKIADTRRSPARFSSLADQAHLENQVTQVDGALFGAGTLRAHGTAASISSPELLEQRRQQGKPPQPVQIVCSRSARVDPQLQFFRQKVPRWLITTATGAKRWQGGSEFEQILVEQTEAESINWIAAFEHLAELGLARLAVLGGGELIASLLAVGLIDEVWLTVCPLILGGASAPTPAEGGGFLADLAPRLELLTTQTVDQEIFLHYRLQH